MKLNCIRLRTNDGNRDIVGMLSNGRLTIFSYYSLKYKGYLWNSTRKIYIRKYVNKEYGFYRDFIYPNMQTG